MSQKTLEGRFNAQKEKFISLLKQKGAFIEHCAEQGYIYQLMGPVFGKNTRFVVALKNGFISLIDMRTI